jgi:hypothetical protein
MMDRGSATALAYLTVALAVLQAAFRGVGLGAITLSLLSLTLSLFIGGPSTLATICGAVGSVSLIAAWVTGRQITRTVQRLETPIRRAERP